MVTEEQVEWRGMGWVRNRFYGMWVWMDKGRIGQ
jgi:hypothetical protein